MKLAAALVLGLLASPAAAQSPTGDVQGVVVDASGAAVPAVAITVTNTATGAERALATDERGRFAAPGLQVGPYEVTAARDGFATRRQEGLRVQIGETITLRLELGVARLADTLTVAGSPPTIEATRSQVSSVVSAPAIANLPVNGRNVLDLVLLTRAVTRDVRAGDLSVAGQRGTLNSLVVDGADSNNTFFGQTLGRAGSGRAPYLFSQEAVQELQVNASGYSAEYGRAAGAVISAVTKSGTNRFSGSAFEFYRDDALAANTPMNESLGRPKGPSRHNQFGGVLGGPLVENRHFFLASYDGLRSTEPNEVFLDVPPALPRDAFTGLALQRLAPLARRWERTQDQDVFLAKTDHQLTGSHRLALRYNHQDFVGEGFEAGGPQTPVESTGASKVYTRSFNAAVGSVLRPALLNEARVQWARDRESGEANSANPQADVRQGGTLVLRIGRNAFSPRETRLDRLQVADTLTYVRGAHKLKAGVDLQFDDIRDDFPANFGGVYVFQTLAGFGRGTPTAAGDTYTQAFPGADTTGPRSRPDSREYAVFVQDEWRAGEALTLNAGLRYDLQTFAQPPVRNPDAQLSAAGIDTSVVPTDKNNLAPRVGIAWAPPERRYALRAAYGWFYGRTPSIMVGAAHASNGLNVRTITLRGALGDPVPTYPNRFDRIPAGVRLPPPTIVVFDRGYRNPRTQQASGGFEWEWIPGTTLALNYLFARGDDLPRSTDVNIGAARPVTFAEDGRAIPHYAFAPGPFTGFTRVIAFQSTARSRYNGLSAELHRRFLQGYYYRVAYTLGKVVDTAPDATAVVPEGPDDRKFASNPADFEADEAAGDNDRRHRLVSSVVYTTDVFAERFGGWVEDVLKDFTLGVIWTRQSGRPYTAYVSTDINGDANRFNDIAPGTTRNEFRLPAYISLDPRVARRIGLAGTRELQVIWEAFNLMNRPNHTGVNDVLYTASGTTLARNPLFGRFTAQAEPRVMQLAVKFLF